MQLKSNSLQRLTGFVEGPRDTSYEGGLFVVDIQLGETPMALPSVLAGLQASHNKRPRQFVPMLPCLMQHACSVLPHMIK